MLKRLYLTGFAAYFIMFILSLVFYKERTMLNDMAYGLFYMLKDGSFAILHFRFGVIFTQFFAVLLCTAGAPLPVILISYSAGFVIFNFAIYLICGLLKQYRFALVLLLFHTLFVTHTFYYEGSELLQGISFMILMLAYIAKVQAQEKKHMPWFTLGLFTATLPFFHLLLVFPMGYILAFLWLRDNKTIIGKKEIYIISIFYLASVILKSIFFRSVYETHSMGGLRNFITQFPDYFTLYSNRFFIKNCSTEYYWIPVTTILIVALYWHTKEWKQLLLFLFTLTGYLFLINISYPNAVTTEYYRENLYLPVGIFLAMPFVFDVLPFLEKKKMALSILILIVVTSGIRIYCCHTGYTNHLDWNRRFLNIYADQKIIISTKKAHAENIPMIWGTPYEFWIMSTLEQNKSASIIIDDHPEYREWARRVKKSLVVNWNMFSYDQLNPQYFHYSDTTTGYTVISDK